MTWVRIPDCVWRPLPTYATILVLLLTACTSRDPAAVKAEAMARGEALVERQEFARAAREFRRAVEADPHDGELRMKLANAYLLAEDWGPAGTEAIRAADLLPDRLDAQLLGARMMVQHGRFEDGAERISELLRTHPQNVEALITLGNAKARLLNSYWAFYRLTDARTLDEFEAIRNDLRPRAPAGEDAAAEAAFRRAIDRAPALLDAKLALVNFLWASGRVDEGEEMLRRLADENPGHAAVNHALGGLYLLRGQPAEGERYLKNAAATGIYGKGARLSLADYYIEANRNDDAAALLAAMASDEDESGSVARRSATVEFRLGRRQEAIRRLDDLLARNPADARLLVLKSQFLYDVSRYAESLEAARQAVARSPEAADAHFALGRVLFATGDAESAFEELAEAVRLGARVEHLRELAQVSVALGREKEALQFAREVARRLPEDDDARVLLVRALILAREYPAAEQEVTRLLRRAPGSPDAWTQLGLIHAARNNGAAARAAFTRALQAAPASFDAVSGLVSIELGERKLAAAREAAEAALAGHETDPKYLLLTARVYEAAEDSGRAESVLRRLLELDRTSVQAVAALADFLDRHGRAEEAIQLLQQFTDARPQQTTAQMTLGRLLEKAGRTAEAERRYEQVLLQDPNAVRASVSLAALYRDRGGDLDKALDLALAARQRLPDDSSLANLIGSIYMRKRLPWDALPHFEHAVRRSPDDALYRYHLGMAYQETAQFRRGRDELSRALQIDPDFAHAADARVALGRARQ